MSKLVKTIVRKKGVQTVSVKEIAQSGVEAKRGRFCANANRMAGSH
ncbi:MAG: hypothetical protein Q8736_02565 [Sweet potato little leaf phytoplasma]|nr:hypothetical protein [Sweet potato little leaf phytoplasma]